MPLLRIWPIAAHLHVNPVSNLLQWCAQPYLFKMRQMVGVKRLLARQFTRDHRGKLGHSAPSWSAVEDTFKLLAGTAHAVPWAAAGPPRPIWH